MARKLLDLSATVPYISPSDKEEPKTVYELGVLDTRIRKMLEDIAWEYETTPGAPESAKAKASFNIGKSELDLVAFGLKGFKNLFKAGGQQAQFSTEPRIVNGKTYHVLSEDILKIIPGDLITELANKIKEINSIGEEDRKN